MRGRSGRQVRAVRPAASEASRPAGPHGGIVLVSHSSELAHAALATVRGLVPGLEVPVHVAAGMPDGSLGTRVGDVVDALERAVGEVAGAGWRCGADDVPGDARVGVLVLADVGGAVMAAQAAVELVHQDAAAAGCALVVSGAPLVEGLLAAYAALGTGQDWQQAAQLADAAAGDKEALARA